MARFSKKLRVKKSRHNRKSGKKSGRKGKPRRTRLRSRKSFIKRSKRNIYRGGGDITFPENVGNTFTDNDSETYNYILLSDTDTASEKILEEFRTKVENYPEFKPLKDELIAIYSTLHDETKKRSNITKEVLKSEYDKKKEKVEENLHNGGSNNQITKLSGQLLRDLIGTRSAFHHHLQLPKGAVPDVNEYAIDRLFRKRYKVLPKEAISLPESYVFKLFNREKDFEVFYLKEDSLSKRVKTYKNAFKKMRMTGIDTRNCMQKVTLINDDSTPGVIKRQLINEKILTEFITRKTDKVVNPTEYDIYIVENRDLSGNTIDEAGEPVPEYSVGDIDSKKLDNILEPLYSNGLVFSHIDTTDIFKNTQADEHEPLLFCPDFWYSVTRDNITETIFYSNLNVIIQEIKEEFKPDYESTSLEIKFFHTVLDEFLKEENKDLLFDLAYIFSYIRIYKRLTDLKPDDGSELDFERFLNRMDPLHNISRVFMNVTGSIQPILQTNYTKLITDGFENANFMKIIDFMINKKTHLNRFYMISYCIKILMYTIDVTENK